jgi:hypothetical protein
LETTIGGHIVVLFTINLLVLHLRVVKPYFDESSPFVWKDTLWKMATNNTKTSTYLHTPSELSTTNSKTIKERPKTMTTTTTMAEFEPTPRGTDPNGETAQSEKEREEEKETERPVGDLPGAALSGADRMMDDVYGDHVHQNPGAHLDGGITDDLMWQDYWRRLVVFPSQTYDVPSGAIGRQFLETLTGLLKEGIQGHKLNSEQFIVFQMVILQRTREVKHARDIKPQMQSRLDAWDQGKFAMLVQDTKETSPPSSGPRSSTRRGCVVM